MTVVPETSFLVIPKVSSERRDYVPIAWMEPPTVPSDLVFVVEGVTEPMFGLLTSAMHMAWLRHVGGRLESRYRYSAGMVFNTFPMPPVSDDELTQKLAGRAKAVLDARSAHPDTTLSALYDPDLMPADLLRAHRKLDRAVDRLYRHSGFTSERQRAEHLLLLYERNMAPLLQDRTSGRRGRRGRSSRSG